MRYGFFSAFLLASGALFSGAVPAGCEEISAVVSESSGYYMEAFSAFQREYGGAVPLYDLSRSSDVPKAGVVVAFGGKAAQSWRYPESSYLIYCMAPGLSGSVVLNSRTVLVAMVPEPASAVRALLKLQPGLKTLVLLWASEAYDGYARALIEAAAGAGVEVLPTAIRDGLELPRELRRLRREMQAFWLLPDPLLINSENFAILRDFSQANRVPFYAPTAGLAKKGATAAVYVSFPEIGRAAARAQKKNVRGALIYPERVSLFVNGAESELPGPDIPSLNWK
jgi:hypothetical protein